MSDNYAPQRRKLLALESEKLPPAELPESGLIVLPHRQRAADQSRQTALSVPESVRALGEPLEPFFEACGGRQTISLAIRRSDSQSSPETYVFQQPFVLVGRCRESDLSFSDRLVDFRHLYLQLVAGRWMFVDLGMIANGADDDSHRSSWGWFDRDHELQVGPYTVTRVGSPPRELRRTAHPMDLDLLGDLPVVDLEFVTGRGDSHAGQDWRIAGAVSLLGASRQCDLWLRDESVSKVHASLVLTPRGLWVVDLVGRGGVLVNGRPAYWKQIHDGSRLQIGRYRFRVRFEDPHGPSARPGNDRPPEVLAAPDRPAVPGGGLSEQSVMTLIGHMAQMQSQFFEHSQNQMQFMAEMLAHMGRTQQASVRQDMARIEEITRELEALKSQLAGEPARSAPRRKRKKSAASRRRYSDATTTPPVTSLPTGIAADPPSALNSAPAKPPAQSSASPAGVSVPQAADQTIGEKARPAASGSMEGDPKRASTESTVAHARLTERMARLAKERNAGWRRILAAFTRKPTGE